MLTYIEHTETGERIYNRPNGDNRVHEEIFKSIQEQLVGEFFRSVMTDAGRRYEIWFAGAAWWAYEAVAEQPRGWANDAAYADYYAAFC